MFLNKVSMLCLIVLLVSLATSSQAEDAAKTPVPITLGGEILSIGTSSGNITSVTVKDCKDQHHTVNIPPGSDQLRTALGDFSPHDQVTIAATQVGDILTLNGIEAQVQSASWNRSVWCRLFLMLVVTAGFLLVAFAITYGHPLNIVLGQDNRYSNSSFQIALWFGVLIVSYASELIVRGWVLGGDFFGGVQIPAYLAAVSGISALTMVGAKGITASKADTAAKAGTGPQKTRAEAPSFPSDLVMNDSNEPDIGDFQMMIITLLAAGTYLLQMFHFLSQVKWMHSITLPDVDTTILVSFGLGQGAYISKKVLGSVGKS